MSEIRKIYGRRTVLEALKSHDTQVERVMLAKGTHGAILTELQNEAQARNISVEWMERRHLDKLFGANVSQGVVAFIKAHQFQEVHEVLDQALAKTPSPLLLVTDEIEDPRNLGAIVRCAEGAGAHGLIMTYHRSAALTATAIKTSGGATAHLPMAQVKNLAITLEGLKKNNIWVAGLVAEGGQSLWMSDLNRPLALVIGGEGKGLRRLTREHCDFLLTIPMFGQVNSLNAAVATGITLFEAKRQQFQAEQGK